MAETGPFDFAGQRQCLLVVRQRREKVTALYVHVSDICKNDLVIVDRVRFIVESRDFWNSSRALVAVPDAELANLELAQT